MASVVAAGLSLCFPLANGQIDRLALRVAHHFDAFGVVEGGAGRPRAPKFSSSQALEMIRHFGAEKPAVFVSERARNPVEP